VKQSIYGHENAVDSYLDIFAADNATGYQQARVTATLAAGHTPQDKLDLAVKAMAPFGVTLGANTLDLSRPQYPRGAPFIGMARTLLREVTLSAGGLWSVQNGKLMVTPKSLDTGNSGAITLTAATGLVGYPQQTQDGIRVRSLINPALMPLQKITLDPSQIIEAERNNDPSSGKSAQAANAQLDSQKYAAGSYTIFAMDRFGDTRGNDWYDESLCIGQGGDVPTGQGSQGYYTLGSQ